MASVEEGTFKILTNKVMFVNKLSMLYKATSDDEVPTPGYMYQEICKISLESGSHCQDLLGVLVDRLNHNSCHVKLKVLRIMKNVVEKGHPDFKQGLRLRTNGIQTATKHSGPPDPLHGMTPYLLVRKEAEALLQFLYKVDDHDSEEKRIQNQQKLLETLTESLISNLKDAAEKVFDPQLPEFDQPAKYDANQKFGSYQPITLDTGVTSESYDKDDRTQYVPKRPVERPIGRALGGWEDETVTLGGKPVVGPGGDATRVVEDLSGQFEMQPEDGPEKMLVKEWLDEDSTHLPARSHITNFAIRCSAVNCDHIVTIFARELQHLEDGKIMRALLVLESLLYRDFVKADFMARVCFSQLLPLFRRPHCPVQSKARKLLRILEKLSSNQELFSELNQPQNEKQVPTISKTDTSPEPVETALDVVNMDSKVIFGEDESKTRTTIPSLPFGDL